MPATPHAKEVNSTIADLTSLKGPLTVALLSKYIIYWYTNKSMTKFKKSNIPIMTENLLAKTKIVIKVMKLLSSEFTTIHEQRLLQRVRHVIVKINTSYNIFIRKASIRY